VNEPFKDEREASAAARSVIPPEPGWSILSQEQHAELLRRALEAAGVEVSEFESRTAWWLSGWEDYIVSIIARWVAKAAGTETEYGVRMTIASVGREIPCGSEGEARAVLASRGHGHPEAVLVVRSPERPAGPWRLADEPATGGGVSPGGL
jgi:hypothetical protein